MTFTLIAATTLSVLASSAAPESISLSPSVIQLAGTAGQTTTQRLTILNQTDVDLAFDLVAEEVIVRNGRRLFVRAGDTPGSIAATAVFSNPSVVVPSGKASSVNVTVTVPEATASRAIVVIFKGKTLLNRGTATASLGTLLTFTLSKDARLTPEPAVVQPQTESSNLGFRQPFVNSGSEPVSSPALPSSSPRKAASSVRPCSRTLARFQVNG